jgi:predicted TIM-barrel fold metal-dependent hydrolase
MIVDCHTHVGAPEHYSDAFVEDARRAWGPGTRLGRTLDEHLEAQAGVDKAIVLAFAARAAGFEVPNDYVAAYVSDHPDKLIGFASVDPGRPGAVAELERARGLGLRGLKLAPTYQGFDPLAPAAMEVYEAAEALGMPVVWHQGATFLRNAALEHAQPVQLDQVARRFPELCIVIAHMGHPWIDEAMVVIRKHPNLYADVSALYPRPWQFYMGLVSACEYRVQDRLLFGTDYPFCAFADTVSTLRDINRFTRGTGLPRVPDELPDAIIHRDTLTLLGLKEAS